MRSNKGFFPIYRKCNENDIAADPYVHSIWIKLLSWANIARSSECLVGQQVYLERGQLATSVKEIVNSYSRNRPGVQVVRRVLTYLEKTARINKQTTNQGTIITICKYEEYQLSKNDDQQATNKRPTNDQQTTNNIINKVISKEINNEEITSPRACARTRVDQKKYKYSQWDIEISETLKAMVIETNPNSVAIKKLDLEMWANEFRLMRERDKIEESTIEKVCNWIYRSDFWRPVIQTPKSLRKHWDKITGQMSRNGKKPIYEIAQEASYEVERRLQNSNSKLL